MKIAGNVSLACGITIKYCPSHRTAGSTLLNSPDPVRPRISIPSAPVIFTQILFHLKTFFMATEKDVFKDGKWIKNWKFMLDKKPFSSKMSPATVLKTRHKIEIYVSKRLKNRNEWKKIGRKFEHLVPVPHWQPKEINGSMALIFNVKIVNLKQPPIKNVIAPPPPTQPPPPPVLPSS
jgi:hypothetical protein